MFAGCKRRHRQPFISAAGNRVSLTVNNGNAIRLQKRTTESDLGSIPEGLEAWLQAGEKPVYIGLGSIPIPRPELLATMMEEWLDRRSVRIVFCQGWSAPLRVKRHPNLFIVKTISHEWLLPFIRMNIQRLTEAMERALMPKCRSRVAEVREKIPQEDGVRRAAARVEEYFASEISKVNPT